MLDTVLTVPVHNWTVSGTSIPIGFERDSNVNRIIFDFDTNLEDAVYVLDVEGDIKVPYLLEREGNQLFLTVKRDMTAGNLIGSVDLQIVAIAANVVVKHSNVFSGRIYPSINAGDDVPDEEISAFEKALMDYNEKLQMSIDSAGDARTSASKAEEWALDAMRSSDVAKGYAQSAKRYEQSAEESADSAIKSAESAQKALNGTNRNVVIVNDFANRVEELKVDTDESARKAQQSATESARHASESASSADLAGRSVEAIRSMSADAETLEPGSEATASYDINSNKLHFGIPRGAKGDKGDTGERGADGTNGRDGRDGTNGRDGIDGRTPVKGTDYFTPSDVDEIVQETIERVPKYTLPMAGSELGGVKAGFATAEDNTAVRITSEGYMRVKVPPAYDDTEVKADIESLDSKKVGYSEVSGNQLLMYTDSTKTTLLAALDLPAAPVQDVQANGTSIVDENGNAKIPRGNYLSAGIVRPNPDYGLTVIDNAGTLGLSKANEANINKRGEYPSSVYNRPITTENLDHAIKAAMCDGKGPEWSDTEKLAARERMGLNQTVDFIKSYTTTGEERYFTVDFTNESNGDGYRFFVIVAMTKNGDVYLHPTSNIMVCVNTATIGWGYCIGELTRAAKHQSAWIDANKGILVTGGFYHGGYMDNRTALYTTKSIAKLTIGIPAVAQGILAAGSTFDFYGIK